MIKEPGIGITKNWINSRKKICRNFSCLFFFEGGGGATIAFTTSCLSKSAEIRKYSFELIQLLGIAAKEQVYEGCMAGVVTIFIITLQY